MLRFHEDYMFGNEPCYFGHCLDTVRKEYTIKYFLVLYCVIPEDEYNKWTGYNRIDFKLKLIEDLENFLYGELKKLVELNNIKVISSKEWLNTSGYLYKIYRRI